jgi:hypothetical protein
MVSELPLHIQDHGLISVEVRVVQQLAFSRPLYWDIHQLSKDRGKAFQVAECLIFQWRDNQKPFGQEFVSDSLTLTSVLWLQGKVQQIIDECKLRLSDSLFWDLEDVAIRLAGFWLLRCGLEFVQIDAGDSAINVLQKASKLTLDVGMRL